MMSAPVARIPLRIRPAAALFAFGVMGYFGESLLPYLIGALASGLQVDQVTAGMGPPL